MSDKKYLIWSEEHLAWWQGRLGYTRSIVEAERFSEEDANDIVIAANKFPPNGMDWSEVAIEDPLPARKESITG